MSATTEPTDVSETPPAGARRSRGRTLAVVLGALLVLLGLLWVAGYALAGEKVPAGTTVAGVEIGRLSQADAAARLQERLGDRATAPLPVLVGSQELAVDPAEAGLAVDVEQTVESIGTRTWNPVTIARSFFGGRDVQPVVTVDEARLAAATTALAEQAAREPVEGDVDIAVEGETAEVVVEEAQAGVQLDEQPAAEQIEDHYAARVAGDAAPDEPVQLPATVTEPAIGADEVQRAREEVAEPALAAPVTLAAGGERFAIPPHVLGSALDLVPVEGRLEPKVDGPALKKALHDELAALEEQPRDATFEMRDGRPVVVPAVEGRAFDGEELGAAVQAVLTETGDARVATVETTVREPDLTTAEAKALGVEEQLSSFTQEFPYAAYRVTNIGTAARRIDGTVLLPGETFSMNETVGERTTANGFVDGTVIVNGRFREGTGGGVSTITTAMWDAAFHAGLERVEQRAHSLYIPRYKAGLEATVAWGSLDLKFRNDTDHAVYIQAESGNTFVTITIWGTKEYDDVTAEVGPRRNVVEPQRIEDSGADCVDMDGVPGFDITVTRVFWKDGEVVRREPMTTHYGVSNEVVCT